MTKQGSTAKLAGLSGLPITMAMEPLAIISAVVEYLRVREVEATRRAEIAAKRDVLLHAITSERDLILQYFERHFAERKDALQQLYGLLHSGVAEHNPANVDAALTGILGILRDNPLQDLATFRKHMSNPDFTLEL
jgi:hypothetical protein